MPPFGRTRHAVKSATSISAARPAYAAGVRASFATIVPLILSQHFELGEAGTWMSLGGFNGALSDKGGPYRGRALTMLSLMATGAFAAAVGALVGGHLYPALIATFAMAFGASVLRVFGNPGVSIGGATLSVFVVSLAIPPTVPGDAWARARFVVIGGLWAMAIALVLWPLRPYRPARVAISACYAALADYVMHVASATQRQHTAEWPVQHSPAGITSVRTALEHARDVLVQLRRGRPGKVDRGERLLVLSESADQLFGHVVAMGEALATVSADMRQPALDEVCVDALAAIAATARAIADGVLVEGGASRLDVTWSGQALRDAIAGLAPVRVDPQYEHAALILDRAAQFASVASVTLEALNAGRIELRDASQSAVARAPASEDVGEDRQVWDSLRAMLSPGSLILRFALRVAVVMTLAVALTEVFELKRGYWITITVIVILQPYTGVTLTRAVQRVLGTVLGGLLAAGLGAVFHDPRAVLVIATVFVAVCVALLPVNYAAFSVFLTPTFVLLAEASAGDWHLAGTRVANTLIGGALALVGARLLWPSPERKRFPSYAAAALRANRAYVDCVAEHYDDRGHAAGEAMRAARRAIGLAAVNAEESLQRALTEAHGDERRLAPALAFLAYTRRFTASVAALAIARHVQDGTTAQSLDPFRRVVVATLDDLAQALDEGRAPLPMTGLTDGGDQLPMSGLVRARVDRLSRQVKTLHDAVERLAAS